jgi:tRNA pseudouridine38-40 synthase
MFYSRPLDEKIMTDAMSAIVGKHDFRCFMAQGSKIEYTVREIKYCDVSRDGDIITLRVAADGFLYNMVRIIVGTAIMTSEKNLSADDISRIIDSCDRNNAGPTVKACGLYLNKVFY